MSSISIVIPAYQPSSVLLDLVKTLRQQNAVEIVVVDDGSNVQCQAIFSKVEQIENVIVLRHAVNLGKGAALKTAFNYLLLNKSDDWLGAVTADADGQHLPHDILTLCEQLINDSTSLWLGARQFDGYVPLRSKFGNYLTRKIFGFFVGQTITDTQTGLRAIPKDLMRKIMRIQSNGYEYELEMLIAAQQKQFPLRELPIKTIYELGNTSSHFNPLIDSFKIYFVFVRFSAVSITSALLDFYYSPFSLSSFKI